MIQQPEVDLVRSSIQLSAARAALQSFGLNPNQHSLDDACRDIESVRESAVQMGDQPLAKACWCMETIAIAMVQYVNAFSLMKRGKYYDGWCALERSQNAIWHLLRHYQDEGDMFSIEFIQRSCAQFQGLYPYRWFTSPEVVAQEIYCDICDMRILPRSQCGHEVGEIYDGRMCSRRVGKIDLVAVALVANPRQKFSVVFIKDEQTGEQIDHYDYCLVEYVMRGLVSPWDDWSYEWRKALHPHERYGKLGRNDLCPCESGLKYKYCCKRLPGIVRPHLRVHFADNPPADLPQFVFTDDISTRNPLPVENGGSITFSSTLLRAGAWGWSPSRYPRLFGDEVTRDVVHEAALTS